LKRRDLLARQLEQLDIPVTAEALDQLLWFLDELLRWNRRINLTAIVDPVEGIEKHLVDSLTLFPVLAGQERLLDIGSGGGFPSIPLKIVLGELQAVSMDASQKKIAFQRHIIRELGIRGFEAVHGRAEQLKKQGAYVGAFEAVVSRAFSSLAFFAGLALPYLSPRGRIIAMKGAKGEEEMQKALQQLNGMGLVCSKVHNLRLPGSGAERTLIVLRRLEKL
jgi:16S rRNA (guanine527-N7)-methyltransferase